MKTVYTNLLAITDLQQAIVRYIDYWVHVEKTPISQKYIIEEMIRRGKKSSAVMHSLNGLLRQGYIRRTEPLSNSTSYVQLRRL